MVTTRKLLPGEWIFEEIPLMQGETDDMRSASFVAMKLAELSKNKRKRFNRLCNMFPELNDVGIVKTNCYGLGCDNFLSGVFDKLSYLNHSCRPNAERWWQPERGVETVYAIREIPEGEEITIAYSGVYDMAREERQSHLLRGWRFECSCECCELTGRERSLSDKSRRLIAKVDRMVGSVSYEPQRLLPLILEALECCEKEALFGAPQARICYDGYQLVLKMRDLIQAKKFIKRAYEQHLMGKGRESPETKKILAYVQDPTSHPMWD